MYQYNKLDADKPNFVTCKASLLDGDEKVVYSVKKDHWFFKLKSLRNVEWSIISRQKLVDLNILHGTLSVF